MNRSILIALAAAIAAIGAFIYMQSANRGPSMTSLPAFGAAEAQQAASEEEIDTSRVLEMTLGSDDAPLTVVEYASATCPHCQSFHLNTFKEFKKNYIDTGKVKFIYREVYFDPYGVWAGAVARCGGPEKFFPIMDMIFTQQRQWIDGKDPGKTAANLAKIGRLAGLPAEQVDACLQDEDMMRAMVAVFRENAARDEVRSTPTFIIGGEKYEGDMSYDAFSKILDEKLGE